MDKISLKAAIFDFDGTLVNTEPIYTKSLVMTAQYFKVMEDVDFASMAGYETKDMEKILKNSYDIPKDFFSKTSEIFHELLKKDVMLFDGVIDTLEKLKNIPVVIASNSRLDYVKNISNYTGISKYITDYSNHNETLRAKPEPDVFLNALDVLKVDRENVIIVEDSIAGIAAAKKTGVKTFAVTNSFDRDKLIDADFILERIDEIFNYCDI